MQVGLEKPGSPEDILLSLEHHGVKGQKWGVRKKEETSSDKTPIKSKTSSDKKSTKLESISERKEKKAKEANAHAALIQKRINEIKAKPSSNQYVQRQRNNQVKELEKVRDQRIKDAKDIREGHLTTHQKRVLIGVGVTVGVLAAYGTYKYVDSGAAQQMFGGKSTFLKKNDLLSKEMSIDDLMKNVVHPINPGYLEGQLGTSMNCRRCTFAYEMRRRGFDVKATNSITGTGQTVAGLLNATDPESKLNTTAFSYMRQINKEGSPVYKAVQISQGMGRESIGNPKTWAGISGISGEEKAKQIFSAISKHPNGARGEFGMMWQQAGKPAGAHSMAWEMIKGVPTIIDTQTGQHYSNVKDFAKPASSMMDAGITRLDNIPLNTEYLKRWVRNVE